MICGDYTKVYYTIIASVHRMKKQNMKMKCKFEKNIYICTHICEALVMFDVFCKKFPFSVHTVVAS